MLNGRARWLLALTILLCAGGTYFLVSRTLWQNRLPPGIATGNGRLEATEIDVATKGPGRIRAILVSEGDFVRAGDTVAYMDTQQLEAERRQAEAQLKRSVIGVDTAESLVAQREAEKRSARAIVAQREAELDAADKKLRRSELLGKSDTISQQVLDDDRAAYRGASAGLAAAQAQLAATEAAIGAAEASVVDAEAAVAASRAAIDKIDADIADATLTAPRDGRVQYRVAQPGEVLSAGGRVLNLVDLGDVYMTFFIPTAQAGRVNVGSDVRLVMDAAPQYIIPAKVSYVAVVAQFTPKSVETKDEREKLMFRIKAKIPYELLTKYITHVKTGLPGMAYVKIDPNAGWPEDVAGTLVK